MADRRQDRRAVPRAALIGCGRIGSLNDEGRRDGPALTHAQALQRNGRVILAAACDADEQRVNACAERRGIAARYTDYRALLAGETPDLLCICTPAAQHGEMLRAALDAGVQHVLCEKPLALSAGEGALVAQRVRESGAWVAVAHLRRWAPALRQLREELHSLRLGRMQAAVAYYGKGLFNNGSHLFDLVSFLAGDARAASAAGALHELAGDPTVEAVVRCDGALGPFPLHLHALSHRHYDVFELDLLLERGRVRITDRARLIECSKAAPDAGFPGYFGLAPEPAVSVDLAGTMQLAVDQLVASFFNDVAPSCSVDDALRALRGCELVARSLQLGQTVQLESNTES